MRGGGYLRGGAGIHFDIVGSAAVDGRDTANRRQRGLQSDISFPPARHVTNAAMEAVTLWNADLDADAAGAVIQKIKETPRGPL